MKVSELIAELLKMPLDYEVYYEADAGLGRIAGVELLEPDNNSVFLIPLEPWGLLNVLKSEG
jgi:hypothetical protein